MDLNDLCDCTDTEQEKGNISSNFVDFLQHIVDKQKIELNKIAQMQIKASA